MRLSGFPVPVSIRTIGTMDVNPGGYAYYANATGNGEGTRFLAVTNLGMLFEVEVAFGATSSRLFDVAVPVPLYTYRRERNGCTSRQEDHEYEAASVTTSGTEKRPPVLELRLRAPSIIHGALLEVSERGQAEFRP